MYPNPSKLAKKSSDVLLKTTTWGTLIAFALVFTLLGFKGHVDHFSGNVAVPNSTGGKAPVRAAATPEPAKTASSGGFSSAADHATESNPFPVSRKEVAAAGNRDRAVSTTGNVDTEELRAAK